MKKVITFSRQFGSGGRSIAREVAERLGYACYNEELVEMVAKETGFDPSYIVDAGEYAPGKSLLSYALSSASTHSGSHNLSASDYLWSAQCRIINELAEKGNCVIVGRCANYILRERTDCLNVFIYADDSYRQKRILELYGEREDSAEKRINDKDTRRKVNYKYFTGKSWGDMRNYHLCLDSSAIGHDTCVDIIASLAQKED